MIVAGFTSICECGSEIHEGDSIGLVCGTLVCEDCVIEMGEDADAA